MTTSFLGYGRYDDDPTHVGCPRAKSDMTPCAARDGYLAVDDSNVCVGCDRNPANLLKELVLEVTDPTKISEFVTDYISEHYPEAQLEG